MTRFVLSLLLVMPLAAAGDPAPPPPPPKHVPPQAAFDACAKAKQGDTCSFKGRKGDLLKGTCEVPRDTGKGLVCRPTHHEGDGGGSGSGSAH